MNPIPQLNPALKQLRLSGILDSLEARNRQAISEHLAYTDFLALLIHDEIARRDQKKLALRLRRASFRAEKTLDGFDFDRLPSLNRAQIHDLATGRYLTERAPVLIVGPCGTGKSHLAQALGHAAARHGHDVLFTTQSQLTGTLHKARAIGAYERRLQQLAKLDLLIIDDFGLKPLRPPTTKTSTNSSPNATNAPPPSSPATSTSTNGTTPFPPIESSPRPPSTASATAPTASCSTAIPTVLRVMPNPPETPSCQSPEIPAS